MIMPQGMGTDLGPHAVEPDAISIPQKVYEVLLVHISQVILGAAGQEAVTLAKPVLHEPSLSGSGSGRRGCGQGVRECWC